jgi:hypothetical protein
MRCFALLLSLVLVVSCSREQLLQKFSSAEDQATARGYIDQLRAHHFDEIERAADQSIKSPTLRATLEQMSALIPAGEPASVKVVGAQAFRASGATSVNTTFEFDFAGKWFLINVAVKAKDGAKTIVGFRVVPEARSLDDQNRFSLSGKGAAQYIVLGAAIAAALLSLYVLVLCIGTKLPGRKWPWVLFIIFGIGKVTVNWSTAEWGVVPVSVQLFSASAVSAFYGPWLVSASLPLGALVFLIYRRNRLASAVTN